MIPLRMAWRDLLFLHREVDPATLHLPEGLEPDLWEGRAYLGHVPFRMEGVRPAGLPAIRRISDFPETNLRTYVRLNDVPYVWFLSLETPNGLANGLARRFFGLPYLDAAVKVARLGDEVRYEGGRTMPGGLVAQVGGEEGGTPFERWLVDRYSFVARHRDRWSVGEVAHAPYRLRAVEVEAPGWPHATFSDGVDVAASPIRPVR